MVAHVAKPIAGARISTVAADACYLLVLVYLRVPRGRNTSPRMSAMGGFVFDVAFGPIANPAVAPPAARNMARGRHRPRQGLWHNAD